MTMNKDEEIQTVSFSSDTEEYLTLGTEILDSTTSQMRGRMFTRSISKETAYLFPRDSGGVLQIWMMFVPYDLGVIWIAQNKVVKATVLSKWIGYGTEMADLVIELHPDHISDISVGDTITLSQLPPDGYEPESNDDSMNVSSARFSNPGTSFLN